jgi:hypothetical protein
MTSKSSIATLCSGRQIFPARSLLEIAADHFPDTRSDLAFLSPHAVTLTALLRGAFE